MPQTADWKTLSILSILLITLGCLLAGEHVAVAAKSKAKASSDETECLPHCRSNYTCIKGQCVSDCNPPCSDNESCNEGECVAKPHRNALSSNERTTTDAAAAKGTETKDERSRSESLAPPAAKVSGRTHHGFYARMSFGLGALISNWTPDGLSTRNLVSFSEHYELALGGSPIPGLVIGGGLYGVIASSPMYGWTDRGTHFNIPGGSIASEIIGPFVDVYPKPTRGFHFMAALGPAGINQTKGGNERLCVLNVGCQTYGTPPTPYGGVGVGFVAGVGYEAFVADHWSIGGIVRIMYTYANLSPNDSSFPDATLSSFTPGLMFAATYQ